MLKINLEWDSNALAAPQSFRDGVQAAANLLDTAIFDPITVNIEVGYGEYDLNGSQYTPLPSDYSLGGIMTSIQLSYPAIKAALTANEGSAAAVASVNSLPNTPTLDGQATFSIASAQAKAFGAISATDPTVDGYIGFPASFTGNALIGTAITEEIHAMGLLNVGGILGLFSYTGPGKHFLPTGVTATTPAYFSVDGGTTNLANYAVSSDETLFLAQPADPLDFPNQGDALTPLDLTEISAIGFDDTSTPVLAAPNVVPVVTPAGTSTIANVQNATVSENGSVSAMALLKFVSVPSGSSVAYYGFYDNGSGSGHLSLNGVVEPDKQWVYVLDTQLSVLTYVGGSAPGSEMVNVAAFAYPTNVSSQIGQLIATTTSAPTISPLATQATVTGAGNVGLTLDFATAALATQAQGQLTLVSASIAAGTSVANALASGVLPALPAGQSGLAEIDNSANISLPIGYGTAVDLATGPVSIIPATTGDHLVVQSSAAALTYAAVSGADTIYAGAGDTLVFGNAASLQVYGETGPVSVVGGLGGNTVTGGSSTTLLFGTSSATYTGGSGASTLVGGSGGLTATMGSGGGIAFGSLGGNNVLSAGSGNTTLVGGGTGDVVTDSAGGNDVLVAGSGAETLNGAAATGNLVLFGGTDADSLAGGAGSDLFLAGLGNETVSGGSGNNSYAFVATPGTTRTVTITDFDSTHNAIGLFGYCSGAAAVLTLGTSSGGNTLINLSDGTKIILTGAPMLNSFNVFS